MDYTSSYSLLNEPAKRNWDAMIKELGFYPADAERMKDCRIVIFGSGFEHLELPRVGLDEMALRPDGSAEVVLSQPSLQTTQANFARQLDEMVRLTSPGGQVRIYGLPLEAIPPLLRYVSETFGGKIGSTHEIARTEQKGDTVVILRVPAPPVPTDQSYGCYW